MNEAQHVPQLGISDMLVAAEEEKTELDKVLQLLLDPNNIAHNTELNRNEITAFSILGAIHMQRPQLTALRDFLAQNLVYRVSKGRAGRKEWVKIVSRQLAISEQDNASAPGRWGRFFGGKRPQ